MDPLTKQMLDNLEINAFQFSRMAESAVSRCLEGFDGNELGDGETECIKNYTAKLVQSTLFSHLNRFADEGRPAKEA